MSPASRSRAKRGEGQKLREEILDAADALLHETGDADKVSTRAVAERVGCSSPSIYLHFPDRASMLFAVCERQFELLASILAEAIEDVDDPIQRLHVLGTTYCTFALENPQQYRTMMMDVIAGVVYEKRIEEMQAELGFDQLHSAVVDGIAQGQIRAVDPTLAAFAFWAAAHGLVSLMIAKPGLEWPPGEQLIDFVLHQSIDGLRTPTA